MIRGDVPYRKKEKVKSRQRAIGNQSNRYAYELF